MANRCASRIRYAFILKWEHTFSSCSIPSASCRTRSYFCRQRHRPCEDQWVNRPILIIACALEFSPCWRCRTIPSAVPHARLSTGQLGSLTLAAIPATECVTSHFMGLRGARQAHETRVCTATLAAILWAKKFSTSMCLGEDCSACDSTWLSRCFWICSLSYCAIKRLLQPCAIVPN
jgi:hypothetical protein